MDRKLKRFPKEDMDGQQEHEKRIHTVIREIQINHSDVCPHTAQNGYGYHEKVHRPLTSGWL